MSSATITILENEMVGSSIRNKKNSEPFNVRNIAFRVSTDTENDRTEKIQQRMRNLIEITIDIVGR